MRIKNADIYSMIADLWNAAARATDAREQAWCAESVRAEVRASGMTPYEALRGAAVAVCTLCARIDYWGWDDATDDDEDYADDEEYDDDEDYDGDDDVVDGE